MALTLDDRTVTARVYHDCFLCSAQVEPGQDYRRQKVADEGTVTTIKACMDCFDLLEVVARWALDEDNIGPGTYAEWASDVIRGYEPAEPVVYSQAVEFRSRLMSKGAL